MKLLFLLCGLLSLANAAVFQVGKGVASYEVKHLVKTIRAESQAVKGKLECGEKECEFLIAVPVKTFTSSDSNRDVNMLHTVEEGKYPVASARGKFSFEDWKKSEAWAIPSEVDFHGQKKTYQVKLQRTAGNRFSAKFSLKLSEHGVERPSLFTVKVDDEVPMVFDLSWNPLE